MLVPTRPSTTDTSRSYTTPRAASRGHASTLSSLRGRWEGLSRTKLVSCVVVMHHHCGCGSRCGHHDRVDSIQYSQGEYLQRVDRGTRQCGYGYREVGVSCQTTPCAILIDHDSESHAGAHAGDARGIPGLLDLINHARGLAPACGGGQLVTSAEHIYRLPACSI